MTFSVNLITSSVTYSPGRLYFLASFCLTCSSACDEFGGSDATLGELGFPLKLFAFGSKTPSSTFTSGSPNSFNLLISKEIRAPLIF